MLLDKRQLLILHKTYKTEYLSVDLRKPCAAMINIVKRCLNILKKFMKCKSHRNNICESIMKRILKTNFFDVLFSEGSHYKKHINYMIRLHSTTKFFWAAPETGPCLLYVFGVVDHESELQIALAHQIFVLT